MGKKNIPPNFEMKFEIIFTHAMLSRYASVVYGLTSVCLSVTRQILSKWLNGSS